MTGSATSRGSSLRASAPSFTPSTSLPNHSSLAHPSATSSNCHTPVIQQTCTGSPTSGPLEGPIPGDIAWLLPKLPGSDLVLRKHVETLAGGFLEATAMDHPVIITRCLPFNAFPGEERRFEGVLVTSAAGMNPEIWYKQRDIRRDLKKSIPVDHPHSGRYWSPVTFGTDKNTWPALQLTSESKPMDSQKPSYAKFEALLIMNLSHLRKYHLNLPTNKQPRLDFVSFSNLMLLISPAEDASTLYFGSDAKVSASQQEQGSPGQARAPLGSLDASQVASRGA